MIVSSARNRRRKVTANECECCKSGESEDLRDMYK